MTRTREENARDEMNRSAQRASVVSALTEAGYLSGMVLNRFIEADTDAETFIKSRVRNTPSKPLYWWGMCGLRGKARPLASPFQYIRIL